jgi:hypothetical protein
VLVVSRANQANEGHDLSFALRSLGYSVAESPDVPSSLSLSSYKSVWITVVHEGLRGNEEQQLESYVKGGGRLYLTGERPCCKAINESDQRIARAVLGNQGIVIGNGSEPRNDEAGSFNPDAKDGVTQTPHRLGKFLGSWPGALTGADEISTGHVLATNEGLAVGAVFDESDMKNGRGRLAVYMDVDYLDGTYEHRTEALELVENLEDFLRNTPTRNRLSHRPTWAGKVLVLTSESPTNLQAGLDTAAVLRSLHYRVTLNVAPALTLAEPRPAQEEEKVDEWKMPKLDQYSSVWLLAEGSPVVQGEDRELIKQYVATGGSLYLGGNHVTWPSNETDQDILRYLLQNEQITIHDDIDEGTMKFAPETLDGITHQPNALFQMPVHHSAEISGLSPRDVLATDGETATAAAFDEADMNSDRGRLVIYPDDWTQAEPDPTSRLTFVQNIQDFLEATPERSASRSVQYVGLGDSYASGQGSGEYEAGTTGEGGCFHALYGYVWRIANDNGMSASNEACSGAQVYELWEPGKRESQLAAVGPNTTAVTLSVGGDDMGFAGVLKSCLLPHGFIPHTHIPRILFSEGCAKSLEGPSQQAMSWLRYGRRPGRYTRPGGDKAHNENYQPSLQQLYETILYQAPEAELVVVGYPHLFESAVAPGEAFSCEVEPFTLTSYGLKVKGSDIPWINETTDEVDQLMDEAVAATRVTTHRHIWFADPRNTFYTHGLCDESFSYINPLKFDPEFKISHWKLDINQLLLNRQPESFHPTVAGQEALATLIEETAQEF